MNKNKIYRFEDALGLKYDEENAVFYGEKNGYIFLVDKKSTNNFWQVILSLTDGDMPKKEVMNIAKKECADIRAVNIQNYRVSFLLKSALNTESLIDKIKNIMDFLSVFLKREGLENCSELSGVRDEVSVYSINGFAKILSREEYESISTEIVETNEKKAVKSENIVAGIVGAILGSLVGVIVILIGAKLGRVLVLSGIVMGVCTIKAYELLSGKISKKGLFISSIIMILASILANHISIAMELMAYFAGGIDIFSAIQMVSEAISQNLDPQLSKVYFGDLFLTLIFTAMGAIPTMINIIKASKKLGQVYKLGER